MKNIEILSELWQIIEDRKNNPKKDSYTNRLLDDPGLIEEKLSEELQEVFESVKEGNSGKAGEKDSLVWESGDLIYHLMVLLVSQGVSFEEVLAELKRRNS
jgi:phosphoribosyl-ATP pyrophosphohydrolase